jgi:DNA-binding IscR family transcriptional regulator
MLKLTRKADYGLIALKHMALKNGSASAREISDSYGIPLPLLSKVSQKLARTGFVQS